MWEVIGRGRGRGGGVQHSETAPALGQRDVYGGGEEGRGGEVGRNGVGVVCA